jgi:hypothetical protein
VRRKVVREEEEGNLRGGRLLTKKIFREEEGNL